MVLNKKSSSYSHYKRTLAKIREHLINDTWFINTTKTPISKLNFDQLKHFVYEPLVFQKEFLLNYDKLTQQFNLNGFLFAGAAGSGKTLASLNLMYCLEVDQIIIITPKNAIHRVWEDTLKTKIKTPPSYYISSSGKDYRGNERVCIYHYEDLHKALKNHSGTNKRVGIILDESHNLNEITSMRTNLFIDLAKETYCKDVLWLSGTPIKAMAKETIPLFRTIDPLFNEDVEEMFKRIYRGDAGKAVEILNNRLGAVSFVVTKAELKLSDPIIQSIKIAIPNGEKFTLDAIKVEMSKFITERYEYYKNREKEDEKFYFDQLAYYENTIKFDRKKAEEFKQYIRFVKIIRNTKVYYEVSQEMLYCNRFEAQNIIPALLPENRNRFKEVKSIVKYLSLKIKGECLGRVIGGARIACHKEIAKYLDYLSITETTEKKTIIFTSYVDILKEVEIACKQQGLIPTLVYGQTNKSLSSIIHDFETKEAINPLIATFDSLSTAVPLTMCDVMIMINVPFRDYELQQAISRIHRIGATTQTYVYTVFLDTGNKPNISTRSKEILQWSQSEIEKILGVKAPFELEDDNSVKTMKVAVEGMDFKPPVFSNW